MQRTTIEELKRIACGEVNERRRITFGGLAVNVNRMREEQRRQITEFLAKRRKSQ